MKIRTLNNLQDSIDKDFGWRKKELSTLNNAVFKSREFAKNTAIRAGITLLYAHWEGFIKNVATYYLCFVSYQKNTYEKLKPNFLALAIKKDLETFDETNKITLQTKIITNVIEFQKQKALIPYDNIIKTASNLNSDIFIEIMTTIGLSYKDYELSFTLLDEQLLKMRNSIAHGERLEELSLDEKRFDEIYTKVKELMNKFAVQVMNAALTKEYNEITPNH